MIQIDKYVCLQVEEYKGVFSLIEGYINKDGVFKNSWITEEWGKDKTPKTMPKRVKLGDAATMLKIADALYDVAGRARPADEPTMELPDDDVAF